MMLEHTQGLSGEVVKSAIVKTNDPAQRSVTLVLRARFKAEPKPLRAPPPRSAGVNEPPAPAPQPARVVGPFQVEPSPRWITSALAGSSSAGTIFLYNPDNNPVRVKKIEPGGSDFTVALTPIQDGKRYQLNVATNAALKPGTYNQTVRVLTDNAKLPVTELQLEATIYPRVFATPTTIMMPTLPHDAPDLEAINWPMIYIRKVREGGLKIKSFTTTVPFVKLELITEREGEVYAIKLTLDRSKIRQGGFNGNIHIETNDRDVPVIDVPIKGIFN